MVVSPLISLMKDQVDKLSALGVHAIQVNSSLSAREAAAPLEDIRADRPEFLLTTPNASPIRRFSRASRTRIYRRLRR